MTFKPGDKVKFLNDVGGGIVTRIKNQVAYVETDDGFEIPASFSELIKVGDSFITEEPVEDTKIYNIKSNKIEIKPQKKPDIIEEEVPEYSDTSYVEEEIITSENSTLNILLAFIPEKSKKNNDLIFNVYLISDCSYRMLYILSVVKENFCYGHKAGLIEEDTKLMVSSFTSSDIRELQSFKINCTFFKKGIYLPHEPLVYEYKLDLFMLSDPQNWAENDYFDEKGIIINLTEESLIYEIERLVTENEEKFIIQKKRKDLKIQSPKTQNKTDIEEVDLHIEHLTDDFIAMSAGDILDMQMGRFTIALDGALRSNINRIVFIHGVGNGKLKYEIRKTLDSKYPHLKYQDASFKEYGYGATMVMIKK